jgi:hypothetical protein
MDSQKNVKPIYGRFWDEKGEGIGFPQPSGTFFISLANHYPENTVMACWLHCRRGAMVPTTNIYQISQTKFCWNFQLIMPYDICIYA